jgi:hypothetical protein
MKYKIVKRVAPGTSEYMEVFDTKPEAEAAIMIYKKLQPAKVNLTLGGMYPLFEILEGESFRGIMYFADYEVPEDMLICVP